MQAPLQLVSLQGSTLYPQHVLNQEAPANTEVAKHAAGSKATLIRDMIRKKRRRKEMFGMNILGVLRNK